MGAWTPADRLHGTASPDDGTFAAAVHRLAEAGVVAGTGPTSFAPNRQLTRGQAASLAVRAWERLEGRDLTG